MFIKNQKTILIVGAGFLQSFIIQKARALGYHTIAIDGSSTAVGFQDADEHFVVDIKDKDKILSLAKEKKIDGIITGATDYGVISTSYVAKNLGLIGLNYDSANLIKNKYLTRKTLFDNNVDSMKQFHLINNLEEINIVKNFVSYPVIVKPVDGSGSKGVTKANNDKEFCVACKSAIESSISKKALAEDFIVGKEYGVESIVLNGEIFVLSILKKKMTEPPYYAELMHVVPSGLENEEDVKIIVKNAIKALKINSGAVNMDLLINSKNEIYIVDIGARLGGNMISSHIVPNSIDYDYIGEHIKFYMNDPFEKPSFKVIKPIVSRLITLEEGIIKTLPKTKEVEDKYGVKVFFNKTISDKINSYKTNLDGCGYILSFNPGLETSINNVKEALIELENTIERY
ncbi:MAG: ATP-grasp domain-containing protein [Bacilli bacterium]|jgi:biotin carboxylase|nr:ATP-grasp domain-containing protein [Bacilli bacterium]